MTAKLPNTKHIVANSRSPEYSLNRIFIGAHNRRNTSTLTHVSYANPHAKHTRSRGTRCPSPTSPHTTELLIGCDTGVRTTTPLHGAGGRGVPPPPPTPLHGAGGRGVPPPPPTPLHGAGGRGAHLHAVLLPRQRAQVAAVTQPAERREMTAKLPNTKHIVANSRSPEYSLNRIFIGAHNRRNTSTLTHVSYANPHAKHTRTNPEAQQPSPHVLPANHQPAHSMNQHAGY